MTRLRTEWATARGCEIGATSREDANENWALDQAVDEPFVLVLSSGDESGDDEGCFAVEGERNDLVRFGFRVLATVNALPMPGQGVVEAVCGECAETFNPEGPEDLTHVACEDGSPCGGRGEIVGEWFRPRAVEHPARESGAAHDEYACPPICAHGPEGRGRINPRSGQPRPSTERVVHDVLEAARAAPCDACRDGDVERCRCGLGRGVVAGARVRYAPTEAAPPRESVTYVVEGDPFWDNDYAQRTANPPRAVVRLVYAEDAGKPPSRQRGRSGYVDELTPIQP